VNPWLLVAITVLFNSAGTLLLKLANADPVRVGIGRLSLSPWALAAIVCYGVNFLSFTKLLSKQHLSVAYPIVVGCSFVATTLGGALFFGESLTLRAVVGWVAVLAGVTVLAAL
jgi:multidrug transporter EmrE-like cation transporter